MKLTFFRGRTGSALYVDGKLDDFGDHEEVLLRVADLLGIDVRTNDDYLRGAWDGSQVANTLTEVTAYQNDTRTRAERAAELRRQADELRAQATALLNGEKL